MARLLRKAPKPKYSRSVFVNCPFDADAELLSNLVDDGSQAAFTCLIPSTNEIPPITSANNGAPLSNRHRFAADSISL